jgi:HAD superfamily hydrolase (TIGR01509 family)
MPIRAFIFDFDGLIVDTETPEFDVLAEQYREHGAELRPERWVLGLGTFGGYDPYAELEELIGRQLDRAMLTAEHRRRYVARCEQQPLRPGIPELLKYIGAHNLKAAVASSGSRDWVEGWLARHAIRERFQCVRTRTDVTRVKPEPDLFLNAADCLQIPPRECVVLEDSPNGMRAAHTAGMRCVAIPLPLLAGLELPAHTLRLSSLADLTPAELLARVEASA